MKYHHTKKYTGRKFRPNRTENIEDFLTIEEALQININGKPYTVTMRTPGDEIELVRGLFYTESIYNGKDKLQIKTLDHTEDGFISVVNVWLDPLKMGEGYNNSRSMISVSSCGICGKRELKDLMLGGDKLKAKRKLDPTNLYSLFKKMRVKQCGFDLSGGCHAAAIFDVDGNLLSIKEDIGRHNAVDKVIGSLLELNTLEKAQCLLVSGRISYEIVSKCFKAGIAFLAAVSAPSSLAVECAEEMGICLMGFCREDKVSCYANTSYLKENGLVLNEV
jgi:FdhD protein